LPVCASTSSPAICSDSPASARPLNPAFVRSLITSSRFAMPSFTQKPTTCPGSRIVPLRVYRYLEVPAVVLITKRTNKCHTCEFWSSCDSWTCLSLLYSRCRAICSVPPALSPPPPLWSHVTPPLKTVILLPHYHSPPSDAC
jgi:hypothetical protein